MNKSTLRSPAILVLTGASGAGKTSLILKLNELAIPGVKAINCDRVKFESDERADASDRQADVLRYWISHLSQPEKGIELAVLDTQYDLIERWKCWIRRQLTTPKLFWLIAIR